MSQSDPIAVIGAGNVGHAMAGHLALRGREVRLYNRWEQEFAGIKANGGIQLQGDIVSGLAMPALLTTDVGRAIAGARVVMITAPAFAHAFLSEALAEHVTPEHVVVFQPGTFGSSLEFVNMLRSNKRAAPMIAETESSLYSCRLVAPGRVNIRAIKRAVELAALPATRTEAVLEAVNDPFENGYVAAENVLAIGLANGNPVYHCAPSLMNFGRIEGAEDHPFYEYTTESIARAVEAVDTERVNLAKALGLKVASFFEFLGTAYGVSATGYVARVHEAYGRGGASRAPRSTEDRYLTEDIPFGLVPWSSLGRQLNVGTPTMDALIHLANVLYAKDFRTEGRTVGTLGLAGLSATQIQTLVARN